MIAPVDRSDRNQLVAEIAAELDQLGRLGHRLARVLEASPRDRRLEILARRFAELNATCAHLVGWVVESSTPEAVREAQARKAAESLAHDAILRANDFRCAYCGRDLLVDLETFSMLARDHVVAKSLGGKHNRTNRVAACGVCDRLKAGAAVESVPDAKACIANRREFRGLVLKRLRALIRGEEKGEEQGA